ncbi:unnamed protein product [Jaminaea pallidilutea]
MASPMPPSPPLPPHRSPAGHRDFRMQSRPSSSPSSSPFVAAAPSSSPKPNRSPSHTPMLGSPSGRSTPNVDGWWEHLLPQGQLAERLRKAHEAQQTTVERSAGANLNKPNSSAASSESPSRSPSLRNVYAFPSQKSDKESSQQPPASTQTRSRVQSTMSTRPQSGGSSGGAHGLSKVGESSRPSSSGSINSINSTHSSSNWAKHALAPPPLTARAGYDSHFSPLSRTPEISSGSEDEEGQHDATGLLRSQAMRPAAPAAPSRKAMRPSSSGGSGNHYSNLHPSHEASSRSQPPRRPATSLQDMSEEQWREVLVGRSFGGGRGGSKPKTRRVSFDADAEAKARSDEEEEARHQQRLAAFGRLHPHQQQHTQQYPQSQSQYPHQHSHYPIDDLATSGARHWFNTTSLSGTASRRRTRTLGKDSFGAQPTSRTADLRPPSSSSSSSSSTRHRVSSATSAPVSPQSSIRLSDSQRARLMQSLRANQHRGATMPNPSLPLPSPSSTSPPPPAPASSREVAMLRSLQSAHQQISKTTSTALHFSRSILAVPAPVLRPLLQATLLWWVSSATLFALAACLVLSFFLTAWDDMGASASGRRRQKKAATAAAAATAHSESVGRAAPTSSASTSDADDSGSPPDSQPSSTSTSRRSSLASSTFHAVDVAGKAALDSLVITPLCIVSKVPLAVAKSLTPTTVPSQTSANGKGKGQDGDEKQSASDEATLNAQSSRVGNDTDTASGYKKKSSGPGPMPPRPPLLSLIPSIFLTLFVFVSANLFEGLAKRQGDSNSSSGSGWNAVPSAGSAAAAAVAGLSPSDTPSLPSPDGNIDALRPDASTRISPAGSPTPSVRAGAPVQASPLVMSPPSTPLL